jgi:hypothetical protein
MIITKHKESKIQTDYFFIKGNILNINANYFINKIEEGIKKECALNGITNVKGYMTSWKYFNTDKEFFKLLHPMMNYFEKNNLTNKGYLIEDSWGIKETFGHFTQSHNHRESLWSGVIYLSNVDQSLIFKDINEEVEAKVGNFAIFSAFLNHETKNRICDGQVKYGMAFNFNEVSNF